MSRIKLKVRDMSYSSADPVLVKQVTDAFAVFDVEGKGKIDIREVGTVVRALGDLQQLVSNMEDHGNDQTISKERFVPVVSGLMQQKRFQPASADLIYRAFQTLDTGNRGLLTAQQLEAALTTNGEPFTAEEMREMWTAVKATHKMANTKFPPPSQNGQTPAEEFIDYETYTSFMMK